MKNLFVLSSCLLMTLLSEAWGQKTPPNLSPTPTSCEEMAPCKKKRASCPDDLGGCCPVALCELQKSCLGINASGEFLYWKATTKDLPYAARGDYVIISNSFQYINNNSVKNIDYNYDPGFRIGLGIQYDKGWSFDVDWTRFHTEASATQTTEPDLNGTDVILSVWTFFPGKIVEIHPQQFVKFDEVDFLFSKNLYAGTHFIFCPYFGPLYTKINIEVESQQNMIYDVGYANQKTQLYNYYTAAGLKLGFDAEWAPLDWLSLYGRGDYSLVYGHFQLKRKDFVSGSINGTELAIPNREFTHEKSVASGFDLDIGLKGKWNFSDGRFELIAQIGYELMVWLDQIRIKRILSQDATQSFLLLGNGDLGMQGLTAGLELRF